MIAALAIGDGVAFLGVCALFALVFLVLIVCVAVTEVAGTQSRERIRRWEIDHEVWMQGQKKEANHE